jgi:two-component system phosphate regulon sensor histidine kinase PhoR
LGIKLNKELNMKRNIFISSILLIIIGALSASFMSFQIIRYKFINEQTDLLREYQQIVKNEISEDFDNYSKVVDYFSEVYNVRITLIESDGVVIADSEAKVEQLDNHSSREEIIKASENTEGSSIRHSDSVNKDFLYFARTFTYDGFTYILRVSKEISTINQFINQMLFSIFVSGIIGIVLSFSMIKPISNFILKPLKNIARKLNKISSNESSSILIDKYDEELEEILSNFESLNSDIEKNIKEINNLNNSLKVILEGVNSGIMALDKSKKVVFLNNHLNKIFDLKNEDHNGRSLLEIIRDQRIIAYIYSAFETREKNNKDFKIDDSVYSINILPLIMSNSEIDVIIVVDDVSEFRALDEMRKDFVANVSHELKTPLTSIQGFVETLKAGAINNLDKRDKFLDIIFNEARRLNELISDLLKLSEIEKVDKNNIFDDINLIELIHSTIELMNSKAEKMNLTINFSSENKMVLLSNFNWVKQVLINILDNAIKYNRHGGEINISLLNEGDYKIIEIADNGIGMEERELKRVSERFYRVNKSRSGEIGGTGLGLSIVKNIMKRLDGNVEIESEFGKGTKVKLFFKEEKR